MEREQTMKKDEGLHKQECLCGKTNNCTVTAAVRIGRYFLTSSRISAFP